MALVANRRSVMTLFSSPVDPYCHRARIVLCEKGITFEVNMVEPGNLPEDLIDINPYQSVPTLVDRELVLYHSQVIVEYLDERFPHPPLMPVDPVSRAKTRLALHRIDADWYSQVDEIESGDVKRANKARKILRDSLAASAEVFEFKPYFISDDFTLMDCAIAPLLWRLEEYGIELPPQAKAIHEYAERVFERESFQTSLSEQEREMKL
ncbi:MAG: stringent starvation protein A [Gammaproteobacteria bacterium]|nr:stringent starvation protein A [Gammaproteobacteria bacterium]